MGNWPKNDKLIWENSEVLKNLENYIAKNAIALSEILEKKAGDVNELGEDLTKLNQQAGPAKTNLQELSKAVDSMYNADDSSSEEDEQSEEAVEEIIDESKDLIKELINLSYFLADNGDTALAYKLERLINEIKEELEVETLQEAAADDKQEVSPETSKKIDRLIEDSEAEIRPLVEQLLVLYPKELLRLHLLNITSGNEELAHIIEKLIYKIEASIK